MKKNVLVIMICVALVLLMFTPVLAGDSGILGVVNNISATQTILNPSVTAGSSVNITIRFTAPVERLTGAIQINETPAGWRLSPVWKTDDPNGYNDDPSTGDYYINRTGVGAMTGIWSQATQSLAWTTVTRTNYVYVLNFFMTVPVGTPSGGYTVKAFVLSSPHTGGTKSAAVPGATTITVVTDPLMTAAFQPQNATVTLESAGSQLPIYQISSSPIPTQSTYSSMTPTVTALSPVASIPTLTPASSDTLSLTNVTNGTVTLPATAKRSALPIIQPLISCIVIVIAFGLIKRNEKE